jgi:LacI family transcriptional regulator
MKATIYDVAKQAGVSIATVSKVINRKGRISKETRTKVLRIMDELNYKPSVVASALTGKQTYTLGLLLPDLANPFFAEIARNVEDHAHKMGFSVMICSTDNTIEREELNISLFQQKSVDGIILATGVQNGGMIKELQKSLPMALIARDIPTLTIDTVLVDDYIGGSLATNHLIEFGHRQIGIITEDMIVMSSKERTRGYLNALESAGIPHNPELIKIIDFDVQSAKEAAGELIDAHPEMTAIFACNDLFGAAVIKAARERGLSIPGDLSIVGFDNTLLAEIIDPPLTTIAQPIREMGRLVVDLIIRSIQEEDSIKQRIVMLPELVSRASVSGPARVKAELNQPSPLT